MKQAYYVFDVYRREGDPGTHPNSPTRYFILSSIVFHELRWKETLDSLVKFRRHLSVTKGLKFREEIHSTDFVNSPGELKRIKRHDRVDILKQSIDWVASRPDISVTTICVDKHNRRTKNDVFTLVRLMISLPEKFKDPE